MWASKICFLDRGSATEVIQNIDVDKVYDEFCDYQSLSQDVIPEEAWDEVKVVNGKDSDEIKIFHYRMDIL